MEILIKASQLLLSLSILVVLHELGHFLPAKYFRTKVEKFYLFFDPWFSVVKKKIGDTEYGIGWLPLGGYVKIAGMIDESMDKEQMEKPAQEWEFRSKPAWQRLIIMLGGVIVNVVLGVFIYSMTLYFYGDRYLPNKNITDGVWCSDSLAFELGFKNGDKFISADGKKIDRFSDVPEKIILSKNITVERENSLVEVNMPNNVIDLFLNNPQKMIVYPRIPVIISSFSEGSNAKKHGLLVNDMIVGIGDKSINYFDEIKPLLAENAGREVVITVKRDEEIFTYFVPVSEDGRIGFAPAIPSFTQLEKLETYKMAYFKYSFLACFPAGYKKAVKKLKSYIDQFALILSPSTGAYKGLGGFGAIGSMFPASWNWEVFWNLTAFLSLMLAFMNLLPIPALDGGHVVFLLYEIIAGKPANEKVIEYSQAVGMVLLLSLVVYANANDIIRLF